MNIYRGAAALCALLAGHAAVAQEPRSDPQAKAATSGPLRREEGIALLDRFCGDRKPDRSEYDSIEWSAVPQHLQFMNSYNSPGIFLRSRTTPAVYVAHTRALGHVNPLFEEERCSVAYEGSDFEGLVATLAKRARAWRKPQLEANGRKTAILSGDRGTYTVTVTSEGWMILRRMQLMVDLPYRRWGHW